MLRSRALEPDWYVKAWRWLMRWLRPKKAAREAAKVIEEQRAARLRAEGVLRAKEGLRGDADVRLLEVEE